MTCYINDLQSIKREKKRDIVLRACLANIRVGHAHIAIISQDDPPQGDYLGATLTVSLCLKAHLK